MRHRLPELSNSPRPPDFFVRAISIAERLGLVIRSGRGIYTSVDSVITEFHTFGEAAKRVPQGVICLLSALRFHDIGPQCPFEVWMAPGEKDRRPRSDTPRLRIVRFSKPSLEFGQKTHCIEGVPVRIFSVAKTVADSFKYRNKIGLDVALEALRESIRSRRVTTDELWQAAKICRVANVMKPYIEALL